MQRDRFRRLVYRAVEDLPAEFRPFLENVAIVVEREPSPEDCADAGIEAGDDLFGLYVGTPLTERHDYHMVLPDRILIFQGPHERHFPPHRLTAEIQRTVAHEIAHFFGIDDERLEALGLD
ncbi:MAG: metallopeptidase family protein [Dehalococcoidia bacterium]